MSAIVLFNDKTIKHITVDSYNLSRVCKEIVAFYGNVFSIRVVEKMYNSTVYSYFLQ